MLKQKIVFVRNGPNSSKNWGMHEVVGVRPKAVNNIMVIPNVDLRYLRIRRGKRFGRIPGVRVSTSLPTLC